MVSGVNGGLLVNIKVEKWVSLEWVSGGVLSVVTHQLLTQFLCRQASFGLRLKSRREASSTSTFGCAATTDTKRLRRHERIRKVELGLEGWGGLGDGEWRNML